MRCRLGGGGHRVEEWMKGETKAEAGECVHTEVVGEQWDEGLVEGLVRIAYEEVESSVKAERRLKMWEKIVLDRLGEVSSVTGKMLSAAGN